MIKFLQQLYSAVRAEWFPEQPVIEEMTIEQRAFLADTVSFYAALSADDKTRFEQRCLSFIQATEFIGHDVEITDEDRLLVAAGSVILAWGFPQWHYVKVDTVYLVSSPFNEESEFGAADSNITGLVGTQHLYGKMILNKSALHQGFSNDRDKRNVAIHEFAHLIDLADGSVDGLPEQITTHPYAAAWLDLVHRKIAEIDRGKSDIRDYAATNYAEFFSSATEYFFERPRLLKRKHPQLYKQLQQFYRQNRADVQQAVRLRKKAPCPCGSGKRYKRCCMITQ